MLPTRVTSDPPLLTMRRIESLLLLLAPLALGLAGCRATTDDPEVADAGPVEVGVDDWREGETRDGATRVRWRTVEEPVGANALLSVQVEVADLESGEPVEAAAVALSAFMPGHGHGTNLEPRTTELGAGRYLIEGLLMHMGGYWELHVDVVRDGIASRVTFELDL